MGKPIILDGVGQIWTYDASGNLKYQSSKINKVVLNMNGPYDKVFAGNSPYPFHLVQKDRDDKITLEAPQFSTNLFEAGQGATLADGATTISEFEEFVTDATGNYTLLQGATLVASSDEIYDVSVTPYVKYSRVASAPTTTQYTITIAGAIVFGTGNNSKKFLAVYNRNLTASSSAYITANTRTVPFKLIHRANLQDSDTGAVVPVQLTVWKAQATAAFNIDFTRKQATAISVELAVLDGGITTANPSGKVIEFIRAE